jgi:hypothetical protein
LNESERSKSVLLSHLPGLAYRCNYDRDWTMQYVSKAVLTSRAIPLRACCTTKICPIMKLFLPNTAKPCGMNGNGSLQLRQPFKYEYEIHNCHGEKKWVLEMGQGIYNEKVKLKRWKVLCLIYQIEKQLKTLKYNNEHDRWTGLYNREYLVSLLEKDIRQKKKSKKRLLV